MNTHHRRFPSCEDALLWQLTTRMLQVLVSAISLSHLFLPKLHLTGLPTACPPLYLSHLLLPAASFSISVESIKLFDIHIPITLPDLAPRWPRSPRASSKASPFHIPRISLFSFESRCMSIHMCYFLFQLFLSCYQRFNVDYGIFISLVSDTLKTNSFILDHPCMLLSPGWGASYYLTDLFAWGSLSEDRRLRE